ncbi:hypothetical protein KR222_001576 [Zaprionus bogoriensis]|nr:hypothetical protein KR222_001576 [Zaprionus bogoriensis]
MRFFSHSRHLKAAMWYRNSDGLASELYQLYALLLHAVGRESIFYYNPAGLECNWQRLQERNLTSRPQWVWRTQVPYNQLQKQHNREIIVLACLSEDFHTTAQLSGLSASLTRVMTVRALIEIACCVDPLSTARRDSLAMDVLLHFQRRNLLDVALYFQFTKNPLTVYNIQLFPKLKLLKRRFIGADEFQLYPRQLDDLKGYTLRAMPDFSEPNTILYHDASGKARVTGFMWRFIVTFASSLGARLQPVLPTWPRGNNLAEPYMLEFTRNGSVDFGLAPVLMSVKNFKSSDQYSYPILFGSWCLMIPLERPIERHAVFEHILQPKTLGLLLIVFSCFSPLFWHRASHLPNWMLYYWNCWRLTPKLIYMFIFCCCLAQLCSLLLLSPQQSPIDSLDALAASDLRIFAMRSEFYWMDDAFRARYASAFRLTRNLSELFRLRNNFNTSWAYSITSTKWTLINEQQRYFQRPLFRYSEVCLFGNAAYSILIAEKSIYHEKLKLFSMRTHQSGLLIRWLRHSLFDMVETGRMSLKDYSTSSKPQALGQQDLQLAYQCFGIGIVLAIVLFSIELLQFYTEVCLDSL